MPTVLVVEDHEDTLEVMAKILDRFGYRALRAETAEAGLAVLASEKADIMIVDGMMPGMNGTEFIRLCRANADTAHIPIVLYTALMDVKFSEDAIRKGANEVWHKGRIDVEQMRERLELYLNRGTRGDESSYSRTAAQ
ncbi:MAG TPA: response regulator [Tepidisphaeraceae bacterium]|nr:response regulator [Tepidisphaeraceae bacterium]